MIQRLMTQFLAGFHEGWAMFWSPFVGIATQAKSAWKTHVHQHARRRPVVHS
jgi:hypothetical protein